MILIGYMEDGQALFTMTEKERDFLMVATLFQASVHSPCPESQDATMYRGLVGDLNKFERQRDRERQRDTIQPKPAGRELTNRPHSAATATASCGQHS